jgi:transcriptional regulator with XRE-family HTH domain
MFMDEWSRLPFGQALLPLLAERDMSLRELAERVSVDHAYLSRAARKVDGRGPSVEVMLRVARVLNVSPAHFYEYRLDAVIERLETEPATVDDLFHTFFGSRGPRTRPRRRRRKSQ